MKKLLTLVLVLKDDEVLLGLKKRGFGLGKWNGFGGKVEKGEEIEAAAKRELLEECSLTAIELNKQGIITFEFEGDPVLLEVHVFSTKIFTGEPTESDEMKPKWYKIDEIPFEKMWLDDRDWFPLLLKGVKFEAYYKFKGHEEILERKLETVKIFSH